MFDRVFYAIMLVLTIGILVYFSIKSAKYRAGNGWRCHLLLASTLCCTSAQLVLTLTSNTNIGYFAYGAFFGTMDVMTFFFMRFCSEYINFRQKYNFKLYWLKALVVLDGILMIINCFKPILFTLEPKNYGNIVILSLTSLPGMLLHVVLCYFMAISCIFLLLFKIVNSAKIYWNKYGSILLFFLGAVVLNCLCVIFEWKTNKSIILFAINAILIYRNAVLYKPTELVHETMFLLAEGMHEILIIFDDTENCIYANHDAERILGITEKNTSNPSKLLEICEMRSLTGEKDFVKHLETPDINDPQTVRHLKVIFHTKYDKRGKVQGYYFQIHDLTDEINRMEEELYKSSHDSVTGLYNYSHFFALCEEKLRNNPDTRYTFIYSDIYNFKLINDMFGWNTGDAILNKIAEELKDLATEDDVYGRLNNDHFGLLIQTDRVNKERIQKRLENIGHVMDSLNYPLTIYLGVYNIVDNNILIPAIRDRANMAISTIKGSSESHIAYYDDEMRKKRLYNQQILNDLDGALENGEIKIFLQAQTDSEGKSNGAEALVRWIKDDGAMIMPNDFIPVLEKSGAISRLDMRVWELACETLSRWKKAGRDDWYISVNISPVDFYYLNLYEHMVSLVRKYDISPANLRLEITETALMMDANHQISALETLREAGFTVEIDDFGSGYSSLNTLKDISVDVVKLDMRFLDRSGLEEKGRVIIHSIISLVKGIGMRSISEGVETKEQVEMLTAFGCDCFQGYFFSKPIPVSEYEKKYMNDLQ